MEVGMMVDNDEYPWEKADLTRAINEYQTLRRNDEDVLSAIQKKMEELQEKDNTTEQRSVGAVESEADTAPQGTWSISELDLDQLNARHEHLLQKIDVAYMHLQKMKIPAVFYVLDTSASDRGGEPINDARIQISQTQGAESFDIADDRTLYTDADGKVETYVAFGDHVRALAFGITSTESLDIDRDPVITRGRIVKRFSLDLGCTLSSYVFKEDGPRYPFTVADLEAASSVRIGKTLVMIAEASKIENEKIKWTWSVNDEPVTDDHAACQVQRDLSRTSPPRSVLLITTHGYARSLRVRVKMIGRHTDRILETTIPLIPSEESQEHVAHSGTVHMSRTRSDAGTPKNDLGLWVVIRKATEEMSYENFQDYMDYTMYGKAIPNSGPDVQKLDQERRDGERMRYLPFMDSEAYRALKVSAEAFVKVNCSVLPPTLPNLTTDFMNLVTRRIGTDVDAGAVTGFWNTYRKQVNGLTDPITPYLELIRQKLPEFLSIGGTDFPSAPLSAQNLREKLMYPCLIELIWSYWHEEGMLVQSMNAISRRFQNIPAPGNSDPLANLETDPLRPLNNLLWGYIQDEQHRLTVARRSYEYDHHYGITLHGKAVPKQRGADTRSRFLEAYHNLLFLCTQFFQQDDDTNFISDGFPVLNALKEIHLILTQGSHNQFGDLPATARTEMLMQQWLLARPEFREFLPTRVMVALPEPWMDRVDAMKSLQGWTDVSVLHFRNLAKYGEQLLLSIRYGAWSDIDDADVGKYWARFWRSEIQGYIHAYRAVTGVDLTREPVDCTPPSELLRQRMAAPRLAA
jgi:hypothetical protein